MIKVKRYFIIDIDRPDFFCEGQFGVGLNFGKRINHGLQFDDLIEAEEKIKDIKRSGFDSTRLGIVKREIPIEGEKIVTEVLKKFYTCFVQAVLDCNMQGYNLKIISEEPTKDFSYLIEVMGVNAEAFYKLGVRFAELRKHK